jgi:hypothetical protein
MAESGSGRIERWCYHPERLKKKKEKEKAELDTFECGLS